MKFVHKSIYSKSPHIFQTIFAGFQNRTVAIPDDQAPEYFPPSLFRTGS